MAWIESHQDIGQHPKTIALATALDGRITTAVGVLHLLWHFTLKFAWRDGDLSRFEPAVIATAIGWNEPFEPLFDALRNTGWLDEMKVHDWLDYAGKIVGDRLYNEKRRKTSLNGVKSRKSTATNRTVPNHTNQPNKDLKTTTVEAATQTPKTSTDIQKEGVSIPLVYPFEGVKDKDMVKDMVKDKEIKEVDFNEFYSLYPRHEAKKDGEKAWKSLNPSLELWEKSIKPSLLIFKKSDAWKKEDGRFIPLPASWIRGRRWEDEIPVETKKDEVVG